MRQLVGLRCVICQERISSVLEGRFCSSCQNAIHNQCAATTSAPLGRDICHLCGINLEQAEAQTKTEEHERLVRIAPRKGYPISMLCPKCGKGEHKKRKSEKWIAFSADRVCTACGTRYTPPTPAWAGVVFVFAGLPLVGIGLTGVVIGIARGPVGLPGMACEGFLGVLGVLSIIHGLRSLLNPGKI
jgi:hypothetical protein